MIKKFFRFIKRSFSFLIKLIGFLWLISFVGMIVFLYITEVKHKEVPNEFFIYADFDDGFIEGSPDTLVSQFVYNEALPLQRFISALKKAAKDARVKGLVVSISDMDIVFANAEEVRNAVLEFKKSGKKTIVFSKSFGTLGQGTAEYYIASAFDQIWLQPTGEVGLTGIRIELPFAKKALDKIGVTPSFFAFYEYKTGASHFTDEGFTKEHKESLESLLKSIFDTMVQEIAVARNKTYDEVKGIIDDAPLLAEDALRLGIVDRLGYQDELEKELEKDLKVANVNIHTYMSLKKPAIKSTKAKKDVLEIAYINAVGTIVYDDEEIFPSSSERLIGAETISATIRDAVKNDNVKAIVLRIDSPGGEYLASDIIWREIIKAKEKKPIIASLGNFAASGGYFMAMGADKIIAQPTTITGSIGVFAGKLVLADLLSKIGVNFEAVSFGKNAGLTTFMEDFSEDQKVKMNSSLEAVYKDFTSKVMSSRNISTEEIDNVARGRVWSGEQALSLNLVDSLGGIPEAVLEAKKLAGIDEDKEVKLTIYPRPKSQAELVLDFLKNRPLISVKSDLAKNFFAQYNLNNTAVGKLEKLMHQNKLLEMPYFYIVE